MGTHLPVRPVCSPEMVIWSLNGLRYPRGVRSVHKAVEVNTRLGVPARDSIEVRILVTSRAGWLVPWRAGCGAAVSLAAGYNYRTPKASNLPRLDVVTE